MVLRYKMSNRKMVVFKKRLRTFLTRKMLASVYQIEKKIHFSISRLNFI